jgi:hypothetical protein
VSHCGALVPRITDAVEAMFASRQLVPDTDTVRQHVSAGPPVAGSMR